MKALAVCAVLVVIPAVLICVLVYRAGRWGRARRRVIRLGQPAVAWVSSCNVNLQVGGPADGWAIALLSPDERVNLDDLARVMKTINNYHNDLDNEDLGAAFMVATPVLRPYQEGFRCRLPDSVTGGREVYAAHVWIFLADVPGRRLRDDSDFPLPCRVVWAEEGSMMCSRPDGWPLAVVEPEPTPPPTPDLRGPFAARFLTVAPVPFVRELRVRVGCALDPASQGQPWVVAEATRNLQIAVQDPSHPHVAVAHQLFFAPAGEPPARLPEPFAQGEEVWLFDASLAVDDLPEDTRERWGLPEDLFCSTMRLDRRTGRLTFDRKPADSVLGRQRQRVRAAERNGGVPVSAVLVQANPSLFHPGDDDQPGTVVYSPDPTVAVDLLRELADRIAGSKGQTQTDPDLAVLSEYVTNETACPYRRRRVAGHLAGGEEVYIADLHVYRGLLPGGVLRGRDILLCVAEPGPRGGALELAEENLRRRAVAVSPRDATRGGGDNCGGG